MFPDFNFSESIWDVETYSFPVPIEPIKCMGCGGLPLARGFLIRDARKEATHPYRCDIQMKCTRCARTWLHGIVIPEEKYRVNMERAGVNHIVGRHSHLFGWREVKEILQDEGYK